jgi:DNA (cytosine-5)-methyltransferase 1
MQDRKRQLTLGSLFDGSGGFPLAGILSGIRPVWASEIEPFPIRVTTKRMPSIRHYGDIAGLDGGSLPPVDIITFGSPCQDLSIAGKRDGLKGNRSGLFFEAVRIIREMREGTNGKKPRFAVWENVLGAFSSNKGKDFLSVLQEFVRLGGGDDALPEPGRWEHAGEILGKDYSIAWRTLDAQYWGVPQRRRRIFLVADLDGPCAGKILFEQDSLPGHPAQGGIPWKEAPGTFGNGPSAAGTICLNDQGGECMGVSLDRTGTLRAEAHHPPVVFENHSQDSRYRELEGTAPTVVSRYGTGGNNQPIVVDGIRQFDVRFTSEGTLNSRQNVYETSLSRTLDTHGNAPASNQGGVAIVVYESSKNSHFTRASRNLAESLVATDYKDPPLIGRKDDRYLVRRLTPGECARLQGFPSWWCENLGTEEPSEREIGLWRDIFLEHAKALGKQAKPKTDNQIRKWLRQPHTDSAEYKMWGNGVALPCVRFILSGIVYFSENKG